MEFALRKAILMALLAVVSGNAAAEWVDLGSNGSATAYADPSASSKAINIVKMWHMLDFETTPF